MNADRSDPRDMVAWFIVGVSAIMITALTAAIHIATKPSRLAADSSHICTPEEPK